MAFLIFSSFYIYIDRVYIESYIYTELMYTELVYIMFFFVGTGFPKRDARFPARARQWSVPRELLFLRTDAGESSRRAIRFAPRLIFVLTIV